MHQPSRLKADLILLAVSFIWGTSFVAQSFAVKAGMAYLYNAACFFIAAFALLAIFPKRFRLKSGQWKWMIIAGLVLAAGAVLQQVGLFYTKVANASFLTSIYVIFTPFVLWVGYRERPSRLDLFAAALAVGGAFLLSTSGQWELHLGDGLEVLGAFFWGIHLVVVAKYANEYDSISFAAGQFFVCALVNFAIGIFVEPLGALLAPAVIGATLYRALLSIGVGYTLQIWGQKHTPPSDAALIFAMESVFAALVAWVVIHESLTSVQILGCVLILVAAALSQFKPAPEHP